MKTTILIAAMLLTSPALATPINVSIDYEYDQDGMTICLPCGPGTINIDGAGNYNFSWYGGAGRAHDAYDLANASGTPIFDASVYDDFDNWNAANPNALIVDYQNGFDLGVEVYQDGLQSAVYQDQLAIDAIGGAWSTASFDEGYGVNFTILSDAPPSKSVPEPASILLLGFGVLLTRLRRVFP